MSNTFPALQKAIPGLPETNLTLAEIVDRIILGPSLSSPLARNTILKMLESLGRADLKDPVVSSTIPLRAVRDRRRRYGARTANSGKLAKSRALNV